MHICGRVMMQKSVCRVSVHEERVCFCAHVRISAPVKEKMIQQKLSSGIFSQNADFKLRNSDLPEMSELWKKKKGHNSKCFHRKRLSVGTQAYFLQLPAFRCHCLLLLTLPTTSWISPHLYDRRGMVIIRNTFNSNISAPPFASKSKNHTAAARSSLSAIKKNSPPLRSNALCLILPMCLGTSAANMAASLSLSFRAPRAGCGITAAPVTTSKGRRTGKKAARCK